MSNRPFVSVIMPVYNVEDLLPRSLDSVLAQNYPNLEILCVDDCSTDDSRAILEKYAKQHSEIKVLTYENNRRPGGARDFALQHAKGEFIQFVDSDDYINADFLDKYMAHADDSVDIIMGGYYRVTGDQVKEYTVSENQQMQWIYPAAWNKVFRRTFLMDNQINFRGLKHYEDGPFNIRCMVKNPNIRFIDYSGYYYVCNPNSVTKSGDQFIKYKEYVENYRGLKDEISCVDKNTNIYNMLEYEFVQGLTICMLSMVRHIKWKKAKELMDLRRECLDELFPAYGQNPYLKKDKLSKELPEVKMALSIYIIFEKVKLDKLLVWMLAL